MGELDVLIAALAVPPARGVLRLDPLTGAHREALRAACAADEAIWAIYPVNWGPDGFDIAFAALLANPQRIAFAIVDDGELVGMTSYINPDPARQIVEVGNTYLRPASRGTGLNGRVKQLILGHAFASGVRRVEFRIDDRNARSKAAVAKIGGVFEGVMREERITWNGHLRDTCLYSILKREWPHPSTAG